ncbi:hypothetical protein ACHAXA_007350 [Cyclostephanos tholiformis]|uniref:Uncharacterized protein n=1 Tax=Cyclostephanos tholiformis TaxID=382380 RepID=A0ABD3RW14_9STRA
MVKYATLTKAFNIIPSLHTLKIRASGLLGPRKSKMRANVHGSTRASRMSRHGEFIWADEIGDNVTNVEARRVHDEEKARARIAIRESLVSEAAMRHMRRIVPSRSTPVDRRSSDERESVKEWERESEERVRNRELL